MVLVFDILHNQLRLITVASWRSKRIYVKALLTHKDEFSLNLTEKLLTYALGRGLESRYDMPAVRHIVHEWTTADYRWSAVILEIVKSTPFQMRRAES